MYRRYFAIKFITHAQRDGVIQIQNKTVGMSIRLDTSRLTAFGNSIIDPRLARIIVFCTFRGRQYDNKKQEE